jgi:hypothetical protein
MAALYFPLAVLEAHSKLLSNDEIYTLHIASAPSIRGMLSLSREIDLHPPLHYLTERLSLAAPLPRWLSARLPSIIAGFVVCLALFRFTQKRLGNLFGLIAVSAFWYTPALDFAWTNRPYMQWLAWLALLLLARDVAVQLPRPKWAVPAVLVIASAMVMTHLLGLVCLGPFWLAEGYRAYTRRRIDWPMMLALALPVLLGLGSYYQLHEVTKNSFPLDNLPSVALAESIYGGLIANTVTIVSGCFLGVMLLLRQKPKTGASPDYVQPVRTGQKFDRQDVLLLIALLCLPLFLLIPSGILHIQFWLRYGAAAAPAWAALTAWIVARRLPLARVTAVVLVAASVGYMVRQTVKESGPQGNGMLIQGGRYPIRLSALDPSLPIVAASPMTYVEMSDREKPEIARRVFYLTNHDGALKFAHYTLFENEDKIRRLLQLPSQTEALTPFLAEHATFYVVGDYNWSDVWLLRKLSADGMTLNYLGKFESTYESNDLYLVSK